jgi:general secretion pathway protein A
MYLGFFGLHEKPFAITPDPRYLYLSSRHAEALAHLVYGINDAGGFIQLTGEVGTGKTTTIRSLLARAPKNAEIALIINPRMSPVEFMLTICEELGLGLPDSAEGNLKELVDVLNRYLLRMHAEGRRVVLIVDEAQNLTPEVLEQVRLLTNLETASQKLLQIILIGQPELRELLGRNELRQLAQRVTARYHLDPLSADETAGYVCHRLRVAGSTTEIFKASALREVYRVSGGVPRVINVICDRALLGAYTHEQHEVSARLVRQSASEVFDQRLAPAWLAPLASVAALLVLAGAAYTVWRFGPWTHPVKTNLPTAAVIRAAAANNSISGSLGGASPAAVAPASPGAPLTAPLSQVLASAGNRSSPDDALGALLKLWQANFVADDGDPCSQAARQGLECVSLRSSLAQLRELNRPAVLMLSDGERRVHQVVLVALDANNAQLQVGSSTAYVSIAELSRYWFGDLVLLWRPATPTVNSLTIGMRGPAVRELRTRLLRWNGVPPDASTGAAFDKELAHLVEEFQKAHYLTADGTAGLDTQLMLDSTLAAPGSPLLRPMTEHG